MSKLKKNKLKIGLILEDSSRPVWISDLINDINESSFLSANVTLISESNITESKTDRSWRHALYSLYVKLEDYRWAGKSEDYQTIDDAVSANETSELLIKLSEPDNKEIETVKGHDLDVLLNLTSNSISEKLMTATKAGIWSLRYCNGETKKQTFPVGFWEAYNGDATMECSLNASIPGAITDRQLQRTLFATDDRASARMNRNKAYRISRNVVLRKLNQLHESGLNVFLDAHSHEATANTLKSHSDDFQLQKPGNVRMSRFFSMKLLNSLKMRIMNSLFTEQWAMRYRLSDGLSMDFRRFEKLTPPQGGLWADPFITHFEEKYHLFFEDAISDKENADISVMTIEEDGTLSDPKPCLIRPYHLSYPFVFFWEGEHYMIPESKSNNAIELYKAKKFPDQWEFHSNLMKDVEAVDTTLLFHNNKWWLFANFKPKKWISINNELSIFYADSPLSKDWTPHPMNPVVSDVRSARPAGRIYEQDGKLIRPSQDSSVRYGYGLRLNEIVTLSETSYQEREIDFIEPKWEKMLRGTHTLAHAKNLTVIDVLEWRFRYF